MDLHLSKPFGVTFFKPSWDMGQSDESIKGQENRKGSFRF